jgi:hypothetical protein
MPAPQITTISSGFRASTVFTLDRSDKPFVVSVPSYTPIAIQVQGALASDATSAQYGTIHGPLGSTGAMTVFSGAGPAWTPPIVTGTPYLRLLATANVTIPVSLTILATQLQT